MTADGARVAASVALGVAGAALLYAIHGALFRRALNRRLRALSRAAAELARGDLQRRIPVVGRDELSELERRFNAMADDLQSRYLASTRDGLTGAYSRPHFDALLEREIARATRTRESVSVLLCDFDGFGRLNRQAGHAVGDHLLRDAVARWAAHLRETDVLARYGGDEFAILLPAATSGDAVRVAHRLLAIAATLEAPFGQPAGLTCSVGVATFPAIRSSRELLRAADQALYMAKSRGGNQVALAGGAADDPGERAAAAASQPRA